MSTTAQPTILFLGATGGVTNAGLVHSLKAGYQCTALVRTPEKLRKMLTDQDLTEAELNSLLITPKGNALSIADVKGALTVGGPGSLPSYIVFGLGGAPHLRFDIWHPLQFAGLDQPNICGDAAQTLIKALSELYTEQPQLKAKKPALVFVSTTGISDGPEDVPFWYRFLYRQLLHLPHVDKRNMENEFRANVRASEDQKAFRIATGLRPTILLGASDINDKYGQDTIRVGTEQRPAQGYVIKRADVGEWLFRNLIESDAGKSRYEGEMVSLTC